MNFFKTCRTNVYLFEDLRKIRYVVYRANQRLAPRDMLHVVAQLRQETILCSCTASELVVFNVSEDKEEEPGHKQTVERLIRASGLDVFSESSLSVDSDAELERERPVRDALFGAIDGAFDVSFQGVPGMLRVAPRTWFFQDVADEARNVWLRLHLHITPANSLYATTTASKSLLHPARHSPISPGQKLLIAPTGIIAEAETASATAASDNVANSVWKDAVIAWLHNYSIVVDPSKSWINVNLSLGLTVLWPSQLLLSIRSEVFPEDEADDWKKWFLSHGEKDSFHCPLAVAEDWYTASVRKEQAVQPQMERASAIQMSTQGNEDTLATSPPFVQRIVDQQASASGIYPTPPDGLIPGTSTQPQLESAMHSDMTASNPEATLVATDATPLPQAVNALTDREQFREDTDDLFGDDMGVVDFAGDVGDADFSFFDEPDESEQKEVEMQDTTMLDAVGGAEEDVVNDAVIEAPKVEQQHSEATQTDNTTMMGGFNVEESTPLIMPSDEKDSPRTSSTPVKPLSPFGVKERLLPPPIPASARLSDAALSSQQPRRSSTFDPVIFRDGLQLSQKYALDRFLSSSAEDVPMPPNGDISLPPRRKKPRTKVVREHHIGEPPEVSESEEDSYESDSSSSDDDMPPKLPWDTKKRKRTSWHDALTQDESLSNEHDGDERGGGSVSEVEAWTLLCDLEWVAGADAPSLVNMEESRKSQPVSAAVDLFELSKMDLVYIAQVICEQSTSNLPALSRQLRRTGATDPVNFYAVAIALHTFIESTLQQSLGGGHVSDVSSLALIKEPAQRSISTPGQPRPVQSRPHQRPDSANSGPDVFALATPYLRVRRGQERYELLPPALKFWETLSIGPYHGPKDVRAFSIFPWNEELQRLIENFLGDIGTAYENCKLGSHIHVRGLSEDSKMDEYEDGLAPVECDGQTDMETVLRAYGSTCRQLGKFLANIGHEEGDKTIVIYMVNPFQNDGYAIQYLSACFWMLCKAYRDYAPKMTKKISRSDVALQILPIDIFASQDTPTTLTPEQMALIVREVYDRCPPLEDHYCGDDFTLPYLSAPAVELGSLPPKRIGFQLVADPPTDLLHEGSAIHLAYATSADGLWVAVAWLDNTGRCQNSHSFCLRGRSFAEVAEEAWDRTKDILASRQVFWRIFIVTESDCDESVMACWRKVVGRPRKQPFSVTFLAAQSSPMLRLMPSGLGGDENCTNNNAGGFLTPVTTPGGSAMTVSPDPGHVTAPPTPAPSDSVASLAENDPEAHLINLEDDAWGLLFSPNYAQSLDSELQPAASGAIFKRGEAGLDSSSTDRVPSMHLPSLKLDLLWTLQTRPNGNVDEAHVKQAEMTLREVMRMYRNLSVLTRAKGLERDDVDGGDCSAMPLHMVMAKRAARFIDGLLR